MSGGLDEVDTSVHSVVNKLEPVDTILLLEVGVEARLDVVDNWFPADTTRQVVRDDQIELTMTRLSSLFT